MRSFARRVARGMDDGRYTFDDGRGGGAGDAIPDTPLSSSSQMLASGRKRKSGTLGSTKSLASRSLILLGMVSLVRIGCNVPVPGVDLSVAAMVTEVVPNASGAASLTAALTSSIVSSPPGVGAAGAAGAVAIPAFANKMAKWCADLLFQPRSAFEAGSTNSLLFSATDLPFNVMSVGLSPIIISSIVMQALCVVNPYLKSMKQDPTGQGGDTIQRYTFYVTVVAALISGVLQARQSLAASLVRTPSTLMLNAVTYAAGTLILYQISNFITDKGLGDGLSVIISLGIVSGYSTILKKFFSATVSGGMQWQITLVVLATSLFAIAAAYVLSEAAVNVPITVHNDGGVMYLSSDPAQPAAAGPAQSVEAGSGKDADRITDSETVRVQSNPNSTGPLLLASLTFEYVSAFCALQGIDFLRVGSTLRYVLSVPLIVFFNCLGYGETTMHLHTFFVKVGCSIRGLRPGLETVVFLNFLSLMLRFSGGLALAMLAIGGDAIDGWLVHTVGSERIGLTSMLIIVGMISKIKRQVLALMEGPKLKKYIQSL